MEIVRRPFGHLVTLAQGTLVVPIAFLNLWLIYKSPLNEWTQFWRTAPILFFATVTLIGLVLLSRSIPVGAKLLVAGLFGIALLDFYWFLKVRNYSLAFFSLFVFLVGLGYAISILRMISLSFYNPMVRWFEGRPRSMPGLAAQLPQLGGADWALSSLDEHGCFLIPLKADKIETNRADRLRRDSNCRRTRSLFRSFVERCLRSDQLRSTF
jgi:hypothetical protein